MLQRIQNVDAKKSLLTILAFTVICSLTGCDEKQLVCIGKEEEIQIGNRLAPGMLSALGGEADDLQMQTLITRVGKTIADKCDRKDMPWDFYYTNSEIPNAASLPGHIFITRGLVNEIKGEDGQVDVDMLSGIMAHEIAHVVARHTSRSIAEKRFADLLEAGLDLLTKRDVTAEEGAQFLRPFLLSGYSRNLETEADRLGAIYAARAGYAKDGLLRTGQRLAQKGNRYPDGLPWYLRTHPYWNDRLRALELETPTLNDEIINQVAYTVNDHCKGWWGLLNLGVQFVRAKYILKSGAQIELADSSGRGYPDTVIRADGLRKVWYQADNQDRGLFKVATSIGPNAQPLYSGVVGYSPETAQTIKQRATRLLAQGQTQLAIKELNRAIELGATDAGTQLQLARAYAKSGNTAAAQAAYRSVLREDWQGQQADQAATALKGPGNLSQNVRPRQSNQPVTSQKVRRSPPTPAAGGRKITLEEIENEVSKELHIPGRKEDEYYVFMRTWSNAQSLLQALRRDIARQIAAGRIVTIDVVYPDPKQMQITPGDIVLQEEYDMKGEMSYQMSYDRNSNSSSWTSRHTLSVIDTDHISYRLGGSDERLILSRSGPNTFSAHFALPGKVPWNPIDSASSMDISVQVTEGEIQEQIEVTLEGSFDGKRYTGSGRIRGKGTFMSGSVQRRDQVSP